MSVNWNISKKKLIHFLEQLGHFLLAIVLFNSIGVWLPMLIDWYNCSTVTGETYKATPNNLLTYFLGMVAVAIIDRLRSMMNFTDHPSRFLELFIWIVTSFVMLGCGLLIMKHIKDSDINEALKFGVLGTIITYGVWWIAYWKPYKTDSYSSVGGNNFD